MEAIIFIETQKSDSSRQGIKYAYEAGYYTVLITEKEKYIGIRNQFTDVHQMEYCDLNKFDDICKIIDNIKTNDYSLAGIISFLDPHCYTASLLADHYEINQFDSIVFKNMLNKIDSRSLLNETPYSTNFLVLSNYTENNTNIPLQYPFIMKSPQSMGSKDVIKIENELKLKESKKYLSSLYPNQPILLEEYYEGPQYLIETLTINGKVNIVSVFRQDIYYKNRFIVTGYSLQHNLNEDNFEALKTAVYNIINLHGLNTGGCHLEMRYVINQWKLIEINPRISGGAMNDMIQFGLGINLAAQTINLLVSKPVDLVPKFKKHIYAKFIVVNKNGVLQKVTGQKKATKSKGVLQVRVKPKKGTLLREPFSMGDRYAYIIATGDTAELAKENAENAAAKINFSILPIQMWSCNKITTLE